MLEIAEDVKFKQKNNTWQFWQAGPARGEKKPKKAWTEPDNKGIREEMPYVKWGHSLKCIAFKFIWNNRCNWSKS